MGTNNGNGYPEKVDLKVGQEAKLKILRPLKIGDGKNPYFLYRVLDLGSGEEKSFFAPGDIKAVIEDQKLAVGSEFLVKRIKAGSNGGSLELSILAKAAPSTQEPSKTDNFREMMRQCIVDAMEIKKSIEGIDLTHEDLRSLSSCLFIARTKQY